MCVGSHVADIEREDVCPCPGRREGAWRGQAFQPEAQACPGLLHRNHITADTLLLITEFSSEDGELFKMNMLEHVYCSQTIIVKCEPAAGKQRKAA